jgi:hypothetical protein
MRRQRGWRCPWEGRIRPSRRPCRSQRPTPHGGPAAASDSAASTCRTPGCTRSWRLEPAVVPTTHHVELAVRGDGVELFVRLREWCTLLPWRRGHLSRALGTNARLTTITASIAVPHFNTFDMRSPLR